MEEASGASVLNALRELKATLTEINDAVLGVNATVQEMNGRMQEFERKLFSITSSLQSSLYDQYASNRRPPA